jgi:hypothetical protein
MDRLDIKILLNLVLRLESLNERILARQEVSYTNCDEGWKDIFKTYNKDDMVEIRNTLSQLISQAEEMKEHLPQ